MYEAAYVNRHLLDPLVIMFMVLTATRQPRLPVNEKFKTACHFKQVISMA